MNTIEYKLIEGPFINFNRALAEMAKDGWMPWMSQTATLHTATNEPEYMHYSMLMSRAIPKPSGD